MYSENTKHQKNTHYSQMQIGTHVFWAIKVVISLKEKKMCKLNTDPSKIKWQSIIIIYGNQIFRN